MRVKFHGRRDNLTVSMRLFTGLYPMSDDDRSVSIAHAYYFPCTRKGVHLYLVIII